MDKTDCIPGQVGLTINTGRVQLYYNYKLNTQRKQFKNHYIICLKHIYVNKHQINLTYIFFIVVDQNC